MFKQDIDRMCAETLAGRFGPSLMSPRQIDDFRGPSAGVDVAASSRNVAVWTTARSGVEQGKQ